MPLHLLVIENDKSAVSLMTQVFNNFGALVRFAGDSSAASQMVRQAKFDGIFLELSLADVDGIDLTRLIRQSSWNTRTPIALFSRNADAHLAALAFQEGGTFFLPKPLNYNSIRKAILSTRALMIDEYYRYSRISLESPLRCYLGNRELGGCVARNLSSGGMLFDEDGTLHPQDRVRLLFRLEEKSSLLMVHALVVWANEQHRAGVRFLAMSNEDRLQIKRCVASHVYNL
jgi:CheY-like chemotaxis protein